LNPDHRAHLIIKSQFSIFIVPALVLYSASVASHTASVSLYSAFNPLHVKKPLPLFNKQRKPRIFAPY